MKIVSGRAYWDQEKLFDKKEDKKSRDTVPLKAIGYPLGITTWV